MMNLKLPVSVPQDIVTLTLTAAGSMMGAVFMQLAVMASNQPVLVSVTRSMEIVMAVLVDLATHLFDYSNMHIWYKVIGAGIVTICVAGISISDSLQEKAVASMSRLSNTRTGYRNIDDEERNESPSIGTNEDEFTQN